MARLKTASAAVAAAIAKTDWKAIAEDREKELIDLKNGLEEQIQKTERYVERAREEAAKRTETDKALREIAQQRENAYHERHNADHEAAVQARRADFWKGVAMGFDPVRATAIEERQREKRGTTNQALMETLGRRDIG